MTFGAEVVKLFGKRRQARELVLLKVTPSVSDRHYRCLTMGPQHCQSVTLRSHPLGSCLVWIQLLDYGRGIDGYKKVWRASLRDSIAVIGCRGMVFSVVFVQEGEQ